MSGWWTHRQGSPLTRIVHVVPDGDLEPHVEVGDGCWCKPTVQRFEDPADNYLGVLVTHHAKDGRELVEKHGVM